jgi:hypothetical protein
MYFSVNFIFKVDVLSWHDFLVFHAVPNAALQWLLISSREAGSGITN